ncbi:hypothetical protein PR048_017834 [Dryococelus australis]|uniref:Uncharacterized protein n=1 Tax=Dryococelus australis TaxID=614101 RepID=A0ABQ9HAK4_9NEOP|nr:hypothetical protein PR048_017834 [Dryococelus australis]
MSDYAVVIACAAVIVISALYEKRNKYNGSGLMDDLWSGPMYRQFKNFATMISEDFEWLLSEIGSAISKQHTFFRETISAKGRL